MKIKVLLKGSDIFERWRKGGELFVSFDSEGGVLSAACTDDFDKVCVIFFIVVRKTQRRDGLGTKMVNRLLGYHAGRSEEAVLISAGEADPFFKRFGFVETEFSGLDPEIKSALEPVRATASGAKAMRLKLPERWTAV